METPLKNDDGTVRGPKVVKPNSIQLALLLGDSHVVKPVRALHSLAETSTNAQVKRLLDALRASSCTTHHLRSLGISHPAARVRDLVALGCEIVSSRTTTIDSDGYPHHGVAIYALVSEPELIAPRQSGRVDASLVGMLAVLAVTTMLLVVGV